MSAPVILVAIGANLPGPWGSPMQSCRRAADALDGLGGLRLQAVSRWYRSAPVPRSDQPDYVNGVARLFGTIEPERLLGMLQAIEQKGGRVRGLPDAARTLDLDIIDMGGLLRDAPDPVLPHPRARDRSFVLLPLRDVAPDWVEPRSGMEVGELLTDLREGCGGAAEPLSWPIPFS